MSTLEQELEAYLKTLTIKDYRIQLRARGVSPAGSQETLRNRLKENMLETQDFVIRNEDGSMQGLPPIKALGVSSNDLKSGFNQNNYSRPEGQNVGNFLTDRASSRVLAPPGGGSQIRLGDDGATQQQQPQVIKTQKQDAAFDQSSPRQGQQNNYQRPAGQNVGNFLTDRPSSRVTKPPGGASNIQFG